MSDESPKSESPKTEKPKSELPKSPYPFLGTRSVATKEEEPLPTLREDLDIRQGPDDVDGSPTYSIFDPISAQYFMISWEEALILKTLRPGMTMSMLINRLRKSSTLEVNEEGIKSFFLEAEKHNLLTSCRPSEELKKEEDSKKISPWKWLLYHYLYIRVPLFNPDPFLNKTIKYVKPLFSRTALIFYSLIVLFGFSQLIFRFDEFIHTFTYFFTLKGFIFYALAITCVKLIHEFAHAYVAKYFGVRVPTMGAAFIVLWPVLYTDVTDSWKLSKRYQRFAISFAGIAVELVIASLCTLGWALTEPGILQSVFFVICSVTWISTLAVNLNPSMRFDGYYLLCDLWGIDNLQARAFEMSRWMLRRWFLGLNIAPPEDVSTKRRIGMLVYSLCTWIYRIALYTGVAVFVYFEFTKILGITLFFLEIGVFLVWPITDEIKQIYQLRKLLTVNPRSIMTATILTLAVLWFVVPVPHYKEFPGVIIPESNQNIFVPQDSKVTKIFVKKGDHVIAGQTLVKLSSTILQADIQIQKTEKEIASKEMYIAQESNTNKEIIPAKKSEIAAINSKIAQLTKLNETLDLKAKMDGIIYKWDNNLWVGETVAKDKAIGSIANLSDLLILCYVSERYISYLSLGDEVTFQLVSDFRKLKGKIVQISPTRDKLLEYPQMASVNKGELPVIRDSNGNLFLIETYYQVIIDLDTYDESLAIGQLGHLEFYSEPKSMFVELLRSFESIFWRESSF